MGIRQRAGIRRCKGIRQCTGIRKRMGVRRCSGIRQRTGIRQRMGIRQSMGIRRCTGIRQYTGIRHRTGVRQHTGIRQRAGIRRCAYRQQLVNIAGERMKSIARTSAAERNMSGNTEMTDAQQAITVHNVALKPVEFNGQRVVTLAMIDRVHQRPEGTARKRFNDHKDRLVQGKHYFVRNPDEARQKLGVIAPNGLVLLTEAGYLLLVKSSTDDLAWQVQDKLVDSYFRAQPASNIHFLVPKTLPEALRMAANLAEQLETQKQENIELKPKAHFHDAVCEAVNAQTIEEVAKVLGTGRNRLFHWLREHHLLMHNNIPYQEHIDAGRFRVIERQYNDLRGESHTYTRTLITGKGLAFIQKRFEERAA